MLERGWILNCDCQPEGLGLLDVSRRESLSVWHVLGDTVQLVKRHLHLKPECAAVGHGI